MNFIVTLWEEVETHRLQFVIIQVIYSCNGGMYRHCAPDREPRGVESLQHHRKHEWMLCRNPVTGDNAMNLRSVASLKVPKYLNYK